MSSMPARGLHVRHGRASLRAPSQGLARDTGQAIMSRGQVYLAALMLQDIDLLLNDARVVQALLRVTNPLRAFNRAERLRILDEFADAPENKKHRPFCCEFDDVPESGAGCPNL